MKVKCFFIIYITLISAFSYSQNKSSGYEQLDAHYAQNGFSVESSDAFLLKEDTTSISLTLCGGSYYNIELYALQDEKLNVQSNLIDSEGKVCAEGTNKIEADLRFTFGEFSYKLLVFAPKSENGKEVLYVQTYKSLTNITEDHTLNKAHNGLYTLNGVEIIENAKNKMVKEIENHLSKAMKSSGYTISKVRALDLKEQDEIIPYTFYRGNKYLIYSMSTIGAAGNFKVVEPEKISDFNMSAITGDTLMTKEKEILVSKDGVIGMTFEEQSRNLWDFGVRLSEKKSSYFGFNVFVIGYQSKDNNTTDPSKNKLEKAYTY